MTDSPGLYFLGLTWQHTRGSALIGWGRDDAEFIAERIKEFQGRTAAEETGEAGQAELGRLTSSTKGGR